MAYVHNPLAIQRAPKVGRISRKPVHRWNLKAQPWQLQPCMIAPVIPGETLKNAVLQARVVTDPVKNRLIGWWHEYYFYYVPFRAMAAADQLTQMVVDPEWDALGAGITSDTPNPKHYFYGRDSIDWVAQCMDAVVAHDFRKPGFEGTHKIDGLHIATINNENWTNSLINEAAVESWDVVVDPNEEGVDPLMASEVEIAMQQYEMLRDAGLIEMTYEDYLKTYGIKGKAVEKTEEFTPELIRYMRNWQYPSNTINPADGSAASAVSWSIAERIDKDRFFREPGFIIGFTVSRPKVYLGRQVGAAVSMLDTIRSWLPKVMTDDPYTSLKLFADGEGPMETGFADTAPALSDATPTQGYYADVRDLFLYGDQFVLNDTAYEVQLPQIDGNLQFATAADYNGLFVSQTTAQHIEQDGLCSLVIMGSQRDFTEPAISRTVV